MLSEEYIDRYFDQIRWRLDAVNAEYIKLVAEQIKKIGRLNPSSVHKIEHMRLYGANMQKIKRKLAEALNATERDIEEIYRKAAEEFYNSSGIEAVIRGRAPIPLQFNTVLQTYLTALSEQTAQTMLNYSNTTATSELYREAVTMAIDAVSRGVSDYNSAIRSKMLEIGRAGMQVQYESGYHRRLDTAIRQNILDGTKQIAKQAAKLNGERIGADGVELSAHPYSALDHEPAQGRMYTLAEFDKMQTEQDFSDVDGNTYSGFRRPIGEWNCRHSASYVRLDIAKRRYTDEQLKQWAASNHKGCDIDGKHLTIYEASQYMRKLETAVRREKDVAMLAEQSGDDVLRRKAQSNIVRYKAKYAEVSEKSGLRQQPQRMVVEGYKGEKAKKLANNQSQTPKAANKSYTDITGKWFPNETPGQYQIVELKEYEKDGTVYKVDGKNVVQDHNQPEKQIAEFLGREVGGEIQLVPRVNNPQGIRTPDYIFNGSAYDLKTLSKAATNNTIFNRIKKANRQARGFIIDISAAEKIDDSTVEQQIEKIFTDIATNFTEEVAIIKESKILKVVRRT